MSKLNPPARVNKIDTEYRLAGGAGFFAARQDAEGLLRRAVLANLLWEDLAYEDGQSSANNIKDLIPKVHPATVAKIAIEARLDQKLRHIPLFIAREMARLDSHKYLVSELLPRIITRADQLTDFVALYFKEGRQPLSKQVKLGLATAFAKFDEYALAKYNRPGAVKLKDVLRLCHSKAPQGKEDLWQRLLKDQLQTPDTWEVALSAGANKKETWTRLIQENKLGALAFLRNLRNMREAKVDYSVVSQGFQSLNASMLLPLNFFAAQRHNPEFTREIEDAMLRGYSNLPKLPGWTVFVVDVSGSMGGLISGKSDFNRLDAAAAMAVLASEQSERVTIYATAGSDGKGIHQTEKLKPYRGFALSDEIKYAKGRLGGGGIFTCQCLEYIREDLRGETPDRIIIFSDSQDCEPLPGSHLYRPQSARLPKPFGKTNYIVDVSAHQRGINYQGIWTAEVSGWSEKFLSYIAALEGVANSFQE